jgi:glycosyltransferase involved in cell wall biosynthesis
VLQLVRGLGRRGHRVLLGLVPGDRFEAKARAAGVEPLRELVLSSRPSPAAFVAALRTLRGLVRREGVDLVHCHQGHDHWLAGLALGRRVPIARTFHNTRSVHPGLAERWLRTRTAAAFAVSRRIEAHCLQAGIPRDRIVMIPGTTDIERFTPAADPSPIRAEFALGEGPVVVSVARMAADRGHDLLVTGFGRVLDDVPDARLLLVGKGQHRPHVQGLVAAMRLERRVLFTGYRDRDLPSVLAAGSCFALMAAGSDESCRAALEAMAVGRPVVARRVGALAETVVHGETGLLVSDDKPETVATALLEILRDPERGAAMGRAARRRVEQEFTPERVAAITEETYRRIVARGRA